MNNKAAYSVFIPQKIVARDVNLEEGLDDGMLNGADPLQIYAAYEDLSPEDMAFFLGCDVKTYNDHVKSMPSRMGPALSPLTADHILNFCAKAKLHPAALTLSSAEPEHACPPNIYRALYNVCFGDYPVRDKEIAAQAMEHEAQRCAALLERDPTSAKIFEKLDFYVSHRRNEQVAHEKMMADVHSLKREPVRKVLLNCFNRTGKLGLFDSEYHISDYNLKQHADLQSMEEPYKIGMENLRTLKITLRNVVGALFGKNNVSKVLDQADKLAEYISGDPDFSVEDYPFELRSHWTVKFKPERDALKSLNEMGVICNNVSMAISDTAIGYFSIRDLDFNMRQLGNKIAPFRNDVKEFDQWAGALSLPEFSYVQYIYSNNALAIQPIKLKDLSAPRPGPAVS